MSPFILGTTRVEQLSLVYGSPWFRDLVGRRIFWSRWELFQEASRQHAEDLQAVPFNLLFFYSRSFVFPPRTNLQEKKRNENRLPVHSPYRSHFRGGVVGLRKERHYSSQTRMPFLRARPARRVRGHIVRKVGGGKKVAIEAIRRCYAAHDGEARERRME